MCYDFISLSASLVLYKVFDSSSLPFFLLLTCDFEMCFFLFNFFSLFLYSLMSLLIELLYDFVLDSEFSSLSSLLSTSFSSNFTFISPLCLESFSEFSDFSLESSSVFSTLFLAVLTRSSKSDLVDLENFSAASSNNFSTDLLEESSSSFRISSSFSYLISSIALLTFSSSSACI